MDITSGLAVDPVTTTTVAVLIAAGLVTAAALAARRAASRLIPVKVPKQQPGRRERA